MASPVVRAVLYMAIAAASMVVMHVIVRQLGAIMHPFEVAFFRNVFGFLFLLPILWQQGVAQLRPQRPGLLAVRGCTDAVAMLCFFTALGLTPLATVTALSFTAPLFAAALAIPILKEVVGIRRALSLVVGFAGALIVIRPGGETLITAGAALTLTSAFFWGLALVLIKLLSRTESSVAITFYAALVLMPITLVAALPVWTWPPAEAWLSLIALGLTGTISQLCLSQSLRLADTTVVLPVDFTRLVWSAILGFLLFAEVP
ncbi:MAG: DMT family transporter, partial [Pseudomonadota bacterium]